ncbi:hypothetical protein HJC99_06235 [Candidatus Saccharibacteria bacterium]|nr:hypothetical protein [Candidatus Saccharibacteria bacterium]
MDELELSEDGSGSSEVQAESVSMVAKLMAVALAIRLLRFMDEGLSDGEGATMDNIL